MTQRLRNILLSCAAALIAMPLFSQVHSPLDVSVTSFENVNGRKVATIHIQNNSGKDVAAWQVAVTELLTTNKMRQTSASTDLGYRATHEGNMGLGIPKFLNPGESYDDHVVFNNDVASVTVMLAAVIYADRTAYGVANAIHDIMLSRHKFAEDLSKTSPAEGAKAAAYAKDDVRRQQ